MNTEQQIEDCGYSDLRDILKNLEKRIQTLEDKE